MISERLSISLRRSRPGGHATIAVSCRLVPASIQRTCLVACVSCWFDSSRGNHVSRHVLRSMCVV